MFSDIDSFGQLCLHGGLLSCVRKDTICLQLPNGEDLYMLVFNAAVQFCRNLHHAYHAFQLLCLWYGKMEQYFMSIMESKMETKPEEYCEYLTNLPFFNIKQYKCSAIAYIRVFVHVFVITVLMEIQ